MAQDYMGGQERGGSQESRQQHSGTGTYEDTKAAIRSAVDKTSSAVQSGYNKAVEYGTEHPQRFSLLTFAAGVGVGMIFANSLFARQTRTERLASPLIDVASDLARGYLRR
jgi:hypothetical protein